MRSLSVFAIAAWCAKVAVAQLDVATWIVSNSPACSLPCIQGVITSGACSIDSIAPCLCTNITLQANLSICVQKACKFEDQVLAVALETKLCAAYPKERKPNTIKYIYIFGSAIVFPITILRLFTRWHLTGKLWVDDYMTLGTTATLIATVGLGLKSTDLGLGQHYWNVNPDTGIILLQRFYVVQLLYIINLTFAKLAIALLLRRIIQTSVFQKVADCLIAFLALSGILFVLIDSFQCLPVQSVWDLHMTDRTCLDVTAIALGAAIAGIVGDILLLLLPLPWIWGLQLKRRTRISVICLFGLGSFTCITSMIRLKYVSTYARSYDPTWDNAEVVLWSLIEMFTSLLCGCLPALWPLVSLVMTRLLSRSGSKPSGQRQTGSTTSRLSRWKVWRSLTFSKSHDSTDSTLQASESRHNLPKEMDRQSPTVSWKRPNFDEDDIAMMVV